MGGNAGEGRESMILSRARCMLVHLSQVRCLLAHLPRLPRDPPVPIPRNNRTPGAGVPRTSGDESACPKTARHAVLQAPPGGGMAPYRRVDGSVEGAELHTYLQRAGGMDI